MKIDVDGDKLSALKHHLDKMKLFANYMRDIKVAEKYLKAINFVLDELFEAVDV